MSDDKTSGGFVLPTKLEFMQDGKEIEQWTIETWEFPDKIDDKAFEEPK